MRKITKLLMMLLLVVYLFASVIYCRYMVLSVSVLDNKLDIYEYGRRDEVKRLTDTLRKIVNITNKNIKGTEDLKKEIDRIQKIKPLTFNDIENIKKANIEVYNSTINASGSGSHIRLNDKDYILTCAHLFDTEEDSVWAILDTGYRYQLKLVKYNGISDIALFRIYGVEELPCIDISNDNPIEGDELLVIGNPDELTDIVTDGIIAKVTQNRYYITNVIYSGSSGGAVLFNGKLVGITSKVRICVDFPLIANYTQSPNIKVIREFLKEFLNGE